MLPRRDDALIEGRLNNVSATATCLFHTVFQAVQMHGVYSAAYVTVHYKEPLKSFEIRVGHRAGFGPPSVTILP